MEYTDAQRGLDIYKQHTLDNDKLGVSTHHLVQLLGMIEALLCRQDLRMKLTL